MGTDIVKALCTLVGIVLVLNKQCPCSAQVIYKSTCRTATSPIVDVLASHNGWTELQCGRECWNKDGCLYWAVKDGDSCILGNGISPCVWDTGNANATWRTYKSGVCSCQTSWVASQHSCYHFIDMPFNWSEGHAYCQSIGYQMVEIADELENRFISSYARFAFPHRVWLGGRRQVGGNLTWNSGNPIQYAAWTKEEPNNSGESEDCMHLNQMSGRWKDADCALKRRVVCQQFC